MINNDKSVIPTKTLKIWHKLKFKHTQASKTFYKKNTSRTKPPLEH